MEENYNEIDDKLRQLAGNKNAFKTPKNYFDNVEDSVFARLQAEKLHPNLEQSVPEGYFDSLEDKVFAKLEDSTKVIPLRRRFIKNVLPYAVAASIVLLVTFNFFFASENNDDFSGLASEDIETYINTSTDLNAYQIAEAFNDQSIENEDFELDINTESLEDYLDDKNLENMYYEEI